MVAEDHEGIVDDDRLIRRISKEQTVPYVRTGRRRISSLAFSGAGELGRGMSVDIEKLIVEDGKDPVEFVTTPEWFCSVYFKAGTLRAENLKVGPVPVPSNPYHGEVWGKFGKSKRKRLLRAAAWYVPDSDVDLDP